MFREHLFGPDNLAGSDEAMKFWIRKYLLGGTGMNVSQQAAERCNVSALRGLARNSGYLLQCRRAVLANALHAGFTYDTDSVKRHSGSRGALVLCDGSDAQHSAGPGLLVVRTRRQYDAWVGRVEEDWVL